MTGDGVTPCVVFFWVLLGPIAAFAILGERVAAAALLVGALVAGVVELVLRVRYGRRRRVAPAAQRRVVEDLGDA